MQKYETGPLSYTIYKNQPEWIKDWNLRPKDLSEENQRVGSLTFFLAMIFRFDMKIKNKQVGLHQTKKDLHSKGNHQQNKKATYGMGENICKPHI